MMSTPEAETTSRVENSVFLERILGGLPTPLAEAARDPAHGVQILYVRVSREGGRRRFSEHRWGKEPLAYFYPASTVKLPVALLALEKLASLRVEGLDRSTRMLTGKAREWQTERHRDLSARSGFPSVENDIRNIFLVSDNDAYNRLFEFLGVEAIHHRLRELGLAETHLVHRLGVRREIDHGRYGNPVRFVAANGAVLYQEDERVASELPFHGRSVRMGRGYLMEGELVEEPMEFSYHNTFPLADQSRLLSALVFPESVEPARRLRLAPGDREWLLEVMAQYPRECRETADESLKQLPDDHVKPLLSWSPQPIRASLRCHNKMGQAYGFLSDNAYIKDQEKEIEFFLSAVIHVNANEIYNDDRYEYEVLGRPFLAALGQALHAFECGPAGAGG